MILLAGIPTETPLLLVAQALDDMGVPWVMFNQRHFQALKLDLELAAGTIRGTLTIEGQRYHADDFTGMYVRLMDQRYLPEVTSLAADSPDLRHCHTLHTGLIEWLEVCPARVVNRTAPMMSNGSKPYQGQLIREYGFEIPETLITSDPDQVLEFNARHQRVIYKSISGVRSIVQVLDDQALHALDRIRWCPTQFQEFVEGTDIRVHVVGSDVFATRIVSEAVDYRYAHQQIGQAARLEPFRLPRGIEILCCDLAAGLGLAFAGIDLRVTPDGRVFCFEVNPCPGYSYYELNTGQPIARAVATYLQG